MLGRILAVALNTFREAVRDRVLHAVLGLGLAGVLFSLALAELSLDQEVRVVSDLSVAVTSVVSVMLAVVLGSTLLAKELDKKTLYVVLTKPIARHELIVGKYFGVALTAVVFVATMAALTLLCVALQQGGLTVLAIGFIVAAPVGVTVLILRARDATTWLAPVALAAAVAAGLLAARAGVHVAPLVGELVLALGEVLVVSAIAVLCGSFSTPFVSGALTFGLWLIGRSAGEMAALRSPVIPPAGRAFLHGFARVVPNLQLFVPGRHALEQAGALSYVGTTLGYGAIYAAVLLALAALAFRKRDLP